MPDGRDRSDLAPMDVAGRLARLRARFDDFGCDGLLVTSLTNVRYLTGFSGSAALLLVTATDALLVSDGRYREQAEHQLAAAGVEATIEIGRPLEQLGTLDRATRGLRRLGLEAGDITWGGKQRLEKKLSSLGSGGSLVATEGLVEELRTVKDAGELARIELAADIADVGLAQVKGRLRDGLTEAQFALELDFEMRRRGADGVAFATIVAAGPNGALPHHEPSDRRIVEGDLVTIDFGSEVDGYRSDMTRTLCVGTVAAPELLDLLDAVLISQRRGPGDTTGRLRCRGRCRLPRLARARRLRGPLRARHRPRCRPGDTRSPGSCRRVP